MMNVRAFYLSNSKSTVDAKKIDATFYNLSDIEKGAFLSNPQGLGLENDLVGIEYGNMELITSSTPKLLTIEGELIFKRKNNKETYLAYQEFLDYCADDELRLIYCLPGAKWDNVGGLDDNLTACIKVNLLKTEKTEISYKTSALHVPVSFQVTSKWLKNKVTKSWKPWFNGRQIEGKITSAGSNLWECHIPITNESSVNAKMNLEIDLNGTGLAFSEMTFEIVDIDGNYYGCGGFLTSGGAITKLGIRHIAQTEQIYIDYTDEIDGSWMKSVNYSKARVNVPFLFCSIPPNKELMVNCLLKSGKDLTNQKVLLTIGEEYASL